jgi:hypothetical protein
MLIYRTHVMRHPSPAVIMAYENICGGVSAVDCQNFFNRWLPNASVIIERLSVDGVDVDERAHVKTLLEGFVVAEYAPWTE